MNGQRHTATIKIRTYIWNEKCRCVNQNYALQFHFGRWFSSNHAHQMCSHTRTHTNGVYLFLRYIAEHRTHRWLFDIQFICRVHIKLHFLLCHPQCKAIAIFKWKMLRPKTTERTNKRMNLNNYTDYVNRMCVFACWEIRNRNRILWVKICCMFKTFNWKKNNATTQLLWFCRTREKDTLCASGENASAPVKVQLISMCMWDSVCFVLSLLLLVSENFIIWFFVHFIHSYSIKLAFLSVANCFAPYLLSWCGFDVQIV